MEFLEKLKLGDRIRITPPGGDANDHIEIECLGENLGLENSGVYHVTEYTEKTAGDPISWTSHVFNESDTLYFLEKYYNITEKYLIENYEA